MIKTNISFILIGSSLYDLAAVIVHHGTGAGSGSVKTEVNRFI